MPEANAPSFAHFLRAAGKLAAARQISALLFVGAVLVLPALTSRAWVIDFVWAYFAMLTLTSVLGLGFERLSGTLTAAGQDAGPTTLEALVLVRLATAPVAAAALWLLLAFVGVTLAPLAWCATLVWIVAGLATPLAYGVLRVAGNSTAEPGTMIGARLAQAVVLVALAAAGASVTIAIAAVAILETAGAVFAFRALHHRWQLHGVLTGVRRLPWRRAFALAGIELVALAYLRADLLIVGRILGAGAGAVYGMLYRVIDGLNGTVGSAGVWLYAESANGRVGAHEPDGLRARSLTLLPRVGVTVGVVLVLASSFVGDLVPRIGSETRTLMLLLAAFPLLAVNAVELHVRSGRGRNREVLKIGAATCVVNVGLCLLLIPGEGLRGAAITLLLSELFQASLLLLAASGAERPLVARSFATAVAGSLLLLLIGISLQDSNVALLVLGVLGAVLLVVRPLLGRPHRSVVLS